MLWRAGRPPRGGVRKACGEPPGRNQRERSRAMNQSAEDGEWSSPRYGGEGTWVPPRRTKVCAGDTVGKSVSDPGSIAPTPPKRRLKHDPSAGGILNVNRP